MKKKRMKLTKQKVIKKRVNCSSMLMLTWGGEDRQRPPKEEPDPKKEKCVSSLLLLQSDRCFVILQVPLMSEFIGDSCPIVTIAIRIGREYFYCLHEDWIAVGHSFTDDRSI